VLPHVPQFQQFPLNQVYNRPHAVLTLCFSQYGKLKLTEFESNSRFS
jgi:hypothetical protein